MLTSHKYKIIQQILENNIKHYTLYITAICVQVSINVTNYILLFIYLLHELAIL